ncbi:hypothetical protein TNIN_51551 [Trichonephila inaurata madagascariensis]|uniref:Uncharacterized protein n=1 Tax=Trichonephila inaurata madagascariensis TaxID=2747483 RepID=A0A8X6ME35_9ARAC|nr:hypothetical protein TNIN_51551 [Trichonephila inaurata madagascariensis]
MANCFGSAQVVTSGNMQTARGRARMLDIAVTIVLKPLRSMLHMFPYQYQCVEALDTEVPQQHIDFANDFERVYPT